MAATTLNHGSSTTGTSDAVVTENGLSESVDVSSLGVYYDENLGDPNLDLRAWRPSGTFTLGDGSRSPVHCPEYVGGGNPISTSTDQDEMDFDESPYPEVRAAVSSVDDPNMPVNTFRMLVQSYLSSGFLGCFFVFASTIFNQVLNFRYPSIFITGTIVQLLSLPFGHLLARILPKTTFTVSSHKWTLNPGPFSVKEHVCITIMGTYGVNGVYAMESVICRKVFYGIHVPYKHQFLLALGSQVFGFSLAGMLRRFVVWPARMIWPNVLATCALFNALHQPPTGQGDIVNQKPASKKRDATHVWRLKPVMMARRKFFMIVAGVTFVWSWIPGYLFTALSMFSRVCWIWPDNPTVNILFGSVTGLGMSVLTFDWSMIGYFGSPFISPWWAQANVAVSFILFLWIVTPVAYFTNTFFASHFPLTSTSAFDNAGKRYRVREILTNGLFDAQKYEAYSQPYLPITLALLYGFSFASVSAIVVHSFLWFRKDVARQFRRTLRDEHDIHSRLMQSYSEVPHWWYLLTGLTALAFIIAANSIVETQLPFWALLISLLLPIIFALPLSILQALANQYINLNAISQLLVGYMLPGRPIASTIFKSFSASTILECTGFVMDLKTGHYMKVPPRIMFSIQFVAATFAAILVVLVEAWLFSHIEDMCTPGQKAGFVCPGSNTFFTASVIWGGVGPGRLFSPGRLYSPLLWFFLVGFLLPIPFYFLARKYPLGVWRYINIPIFFAGLQGIPSGAPINLAVWLLCGFLGNFVVRRKYFERWTRYNYVLSAALDTGVASSFFIMFFVIMLPKGGLELPWWGNSVWMNTRDAMGVPLKPVAEGTTIGLLKW
ncbi:glutathione transporter [Ephemerocybe angulata]|uniref:Glutathione transporter n=1 Tax=Ephemerocybe angulata TaxID=980116 RepID=A0A8H6I6K8_9AGAR|nr:glutathione transporter [Tulosesus angulatus]